MAPKTFAAALPVGLVAGADLEVVAAVVDGSVVDGLGDEVEDPVWEILVVGLVGLLVAGVVAVEDVGEPAAEANGVATPAEHVKAPSAAQMKFVLTSPTQQIYLEMSFDVQSPTIVPEQQYPL
jgi:hypothetical protein